MHFFQFFIHVMLLWPGYSSLDSNYLCVFVEVWCLKTWHNTQAQTLNSTEIVVQDNAMQHGVKQSDHLWPIIFPLYLCPVTLFYEEMKSIWHDYLLMNSYSSSGWISKIHIGCYLFPSHLLGLKNSLWIVEKTLDKQASRILFLLLSLSERNGVTFDF